MKSNFYLLAGISHFFEGSPVKNRQGFLAGKAVRREVLNNQEAQRKVGAEKI